MPGAAEHFTAPVRQTHPASTVRRRVAPEAPGAPSRRRRAARVPVGSGSTTGAVAQTARPLPSGTGVVLSAAVGGEGPRPDGRPAHAPATGCVPRPPGGVPHMGSLVEPPPAPLAGLASRPLDHAR
ncbi:hypothetical protein GCM10012280_51620 [Wenjunlia tyrosinilytica]|uniref:Uncharacterized protein n=1 Tax=Wenjunlia tyrosinilytica TaxID=1544741 RepID=A0A918E161_9ACTN|nr:hypothetical protein GCM10012280_51620 [Wenjunlia tyrosinilytica]